MKTKLFKLMFLLSMLAIVFTACQKEEEEENPFVEENNTEQETNENQVPGYTDAVTVAKEDATAQVIFLDVFRQVDNAARESDDALESGNKSLNSNGCATVTIEPFDLTTWPKTMTVDFGDVNVQCDDGISRRGKIIAEVTSMYHTDGCVITVTFDDYYVYDHHVEGTKIITNEGFNASDNLVYNLVVDDAQITSPDGLVTYWSTDRDHELINGYDTYFDWSDDEYLVTGTAHGTNSNGTDYSIEIIEALNCLVGCQYIRAGVFDIDIDGLPTITVDYGELACDAIATASCFGYEFEINAGYAFIF